MIDANMVDARGLSCPEPVLLTMDKLRTAGKAAFSVAVTSPTARDNVQRTLTDNKRRFQTKDDGDGWLIEVAAE